MKFDEALERFNNALIMEYGIDNGITKIGLKPELFERVMLDLHQRQDFTYRNPGSHVGQTTSDGGLETQGPTYTRFNFSLKSLGEVFVCGVQILARKKDTF